MLHLKCKILCLFTCLLTYFLTWPWGESKGNLLSRTFDVPVLQTNHFWRNGQFSQDCKRYWSLTTILRTLKTCFIAFTSLWHIPLQIWMMQLVTFVTWASGHQWWLTRSLVAWPDDLRWGFSFQLLERWRMVRSYLDVPHKRGRGRTQRRSVVTNLRPRLFPGYSLAPLEVRLAPISSLSLCPFYSGYPQTRCSSNGAK